MEIEEKMILAAAIERYGEGAQLVKCCEELGELTQAVCKLFDRGGSDAEGAGLRATGGCRSGFDVEAVVEEIADVEIMLEQLRMILKVDPEMERRWRERKLRRLAVRLGR